MLYHTYGMCEAGQVLLANKTLTSCVAKSLRILSQRERSNAQYLHPVGLSPFFAAYADSTGTTEAHVHQKNIRLHNGVKRLLNGLSAFRLRPADPDFRVGALKE